MKTADLIASSIASLTRTRGRSALTMLGIVIGIMSVIVMLSIGEAAQNYILNQVSAFGTDILTIANGSKTGENQPTLFQKESLTYKDVKKIQTLLWTGLVAGQLQQEDELTTNGLTLSTHVIGTMPDEVHFSDLQLATGVFFDQAAVDGHIREAIIGSEIADKAFGAEDPLGHTIRINNQNFRVIGVMEKVGTKNFQNYDIFVYAPVTAIQDLYNKKFISAITIRPTIALNDAKAQLTNLLRDQHNIENPKDDPAKDDFYITSQEDAIKSASQITTILQVLLTSIAAISLIVGGIGIMNIMYVSVTERIREIGLRKAIGAKRSDVLKQFLFEAATLTGFGGIIGVILGVSFSWAGIQIISHFQTGWSFILSTKGIVYGLSVSVAIGLVFGYFPAKRAAEMTPMEALRTD